MVYVDPLMACVPNPRWRWNQASHLFADDLAELHRFAARIGLQRRWFQNKERLPHYDLTPNKRRLAVKAGAVEVDRRFVVDFMRKRDPDICLIYRPRSGEHIDSAMRNACTLADRHRTRVGMRFNGVRWVLSPGDDPVAKARQHEFAGP